jgi:hypothetical protein
VMDAVQRMRVRAQQNGRLNSTPQETVTTQTQGGQNAVVIEPANPQVIYVPSYNPLYIWGPPAWGYYPPLWYPTIGFGFGFGPGIFLSAFFPGWAGWGWGGWGFGWGWGLGWFGGGLFVNSFFFTHYGFQGFYGGRFAGVGRQGWVHDPYHRAGVPYANRGVAAHFNNSRFAAGRSVNAGRSLNGFNGARSIGGIGARGFNSAGSAPRPSMSRGFAPSIRGGMGNSRGLPARNYSAPRGYSSPRSYSAPRSGSGGFSGASRSFSGGGHSFGSARSSGGFSGGHSGGGGGRRR